MTSADGLGWAEQVHTFPCEPSPSHGFKPGPWCPAGAVITGFLSSWCFNLTHYSTLGQAMSMLVLITSPQLQHSKALSHMNALGSVPITLITAWTSSKVNLILDNAEQWSWEAAPATPIGFLLINLPSWNNRQVLRVVSTFLSVLLLVQPLQRLPGAINHRAQSWSWESLSCKTNIFQIL